MKTQIIQLESHDETISVKDKMEWSQTHRILLVWPTQGRILQEQLDLIALERHCANLGSQLALVTKDPKVHFHAHWAGIPVFKSKRKAQSKPWRRSWRFYQRKRLQKKASTPRDVKLKEPPHKKNLPKEKPLWTRLVIFTLGVVAVLAIAALLLPSAEIKIPVQDHWVENTLTVQANPHINNVNISGFIPAQEVTTSVEKRATSPVSGNMLVPDSYAKGTVVFSNLTTQAITIPENTLLSTEENAPPYYATLYDVTIPAGLGEEVEVEVQALKPGGTGNLAAEKISAIGYDQGANLVVTNPKPITGGTDTVIPAPTEEDRESLAQSALNELESNALDLIKDQLSSDDLLLSKTPTIQEIEYQEFHPKEGQPGTKLQITIRVQFSAWIVDGEHLQELGQKTMTASQTNNGFQPLPETLRVVNLTAPIIQGEEAQWEILVMWKDKTVWNTAEIVQQLVGIKTNQAEKFLKENYELDQNPTISLRPNWWPWLPFLPFRINVQG